MGHGASESYVGVGLGTCESCESLSTQGSLWVMLGCSSGDGAWLEGVDQHVMSMSRTGEPR